MSDFCGQDECLLDANGRVKLSAALVRRFRRRGDRKIVLFCLPEGAVTIYPADTWDAIRAPADGPLSPVARSLVLRQEMRWFGAFSHDTTISNQGRVTIPSRFREYAELMPEQPVLLVGCEVGIEIWNVRRWDEELERVRKHMTARGRKQLAADLEMPQS